MSSDGATGDAFDDFTRRGWDSAAADYREYSTETAVFVGPLLQALGPLRDLRLLDVACGPGLVAETGAREGALAVGVDVSPAMVEQARRRCPGLRFVEGDAQRLPFADASFDAVAMNFGIAQLSWPEAAFAESLRVLKPGCRLAFTAWAAQGNVGDELLDAALAAHAEPLDLPGAPDVYRFAEATECRRALARVGFEVSSVEFTTVRDSWTAPDADSVFHSHYRAGVRVGAVLRAQAPGGAGGDPRPVGRRSAPPRGRRCLRAAGGRARRLGSGLTAQRRVSGANPPGT